MVAMDKSEVYHQLKTSGQLKAMDDNDLWREAFKLYNQEKGTSFKVRDFCQKCFNKVIEWLEKN